MSFSRSLYSNFKQQKLNVKKNANYKLMYLSTPNALKSNLYMKLKI